MMVRIFLFAAVMLVAVPAHAGALEFFFPSLRDRGPNPSETLQAPFADVQGEDAKKEGGAVTPPENSIPLAFPHRSSNVISKWVVTALSEATMMESADYKADLKASELYFSPAGQKQFMQFLNEKNILKTLDTQKFFARSFVNEDPLLLNEGKVDGRYRWLYDVPLMVTYVDRNMSEYGKADPVTQNYTIRVQIGRSANAQNPEGMWIETWSGKLKKPAKKK